MSSFAYFFTSLSFVLFRFSIATPVCFRSLALSSSLSSESSTHLYTLRNPLPVLCSCCTNRISEHPYDRMFPRLQQALTVA